MHMIEPKWAAKHIADLLRDSLSTVVFTGAGMSTESGIPDFRSSGGLWDGKDPSQISHVNMIEEDPKGLAEFYTQRILDIQQHKPNRGHEILADWETRGIISRIITQNIDGYHQLAGSASVVELHGHLRHLRCSKCGSSHSLDAYTKPDIDDYQCWDKEFTECDGFIRPNVVLFGEDLPSTEYHRALSACANAKLCVILGSSCSVHPANSLPQHTVANGGQVVIINQSETELDYLASYKIEAWPISKALTAINSHLA